MYLKKCRRFIKKSLVLAVILFLVFLQTAGPALAIFDQVSGPTTIEAGIQPIKIDMDKGGSGDIHMAAFVPSIGTYGGIQYWKYSGGSWSASTTVYSVPFASAYTEVKMAVDNSGNPWVFWWIHNKPEPGPLSTNFGYNRYSGGSWQGATTTHAAPPDLFARMDIAFFRVAIHWLL